MRMTRTLPSWSCWTSRPRTLAAASQWWPGGPGEAGGDWGPSYWEPRRTDTAAAWGVPGPGWSWSLAQVGHSSLSPAVKGGMKPQHIEELVRSIISTLNQDLLCSSYPDHPPTTINCSLSNCHTVVQSWNRFAAKFFSQGQPTDIWSRFLCWFRKWYYFWLKTYQFLPVLVFLCDLSIVNM